MIDIICWSQYYSCPSKHSQKLQGKEAKSYISQTLSLAERWREGRRSILWQLQTSEWASAGKPHMKAIFCSHCNSSWVLSTSVLMHLSHSWKLPEVFWTPPESIPPRDCRLLRSLVIISLFYVDVPISWKLVHLCLVHHSIPYFLPHKGHDRYERRRKKEKKKKKDSRNQYLLISLWNECKDFLVPKILREGSDGHLSENTEIWYYFRSLVVTSKITFIATIL